MLRKLPVLIVLAIIASLGSMIYVHQKSTDATSKKLVQIDTLYKHESVMNTMAMGLEKYRRASANFRKWMPQQIDEAGEKVRNVFRDGVNRLDQLNPDPTERGQAQHLGDQLEEMLRMADRYEKTSFSPRDVYQKPEVAALHRDIEDAISEMNNATESRIEALRSDFRSAGTQSMRILFGAVVLVVGLLALLIGREYVTHALPLRQLHDYARHLRVGNPVPQEQPRLMGMYGDILSSLNYLALSVESHIKERHKFILDVASDLKAPLAMLEAGKHLLGIGPTEGIEEPHELQALDSVKRGLAMLSGSLDDLNDIVEFSRINHCSGEQVVDLTELIAEVARALNAGPGMKKQINTAFPAMPVWALVDSRRMERVLIQAISKVASTLHAGSGIQITLNQPTSGGFRGIEIMVQDTERARNKSSIGSGPELDVMRHWISEKGLGLSLAHKIIRAHGGVMTASGVPGTTVQIAIRLPQERIASLGLISPPRGLEVKLKPMLTQQTSADAEV